jgi:hypothetical protein
MILKILYLLTIEIGFFGSRSIRNFIGYVKNLTVKYLYKICYIIKVYCGREGYNFINYKYAKSLMQLSFLIISQKRSEA